MRLGIILADHRFARRIGTRALAKQIGVSAATLNRIERGENCDGATIIKIMMWLFAAVGETET